MAAWPRQQRWPRRLVLHSTPRVICSSPMQSPATCAGSKPAPASSMSTRGEAKDAGSYTAGVSPATSTRMNGPIGIAFDATQNLYIADTGNNVVRLVAGSPGEAAFAAQAVGNTSSPVTVRVSNIGNAPLTFKQRCGRQQQHLDELCPGEQQ